MRKEQKRQGHRSESAAGLPVLTHRVPRWGLCLESRPAGGDGGRDAGRSSPVQTALTGAAPLATCSKCWRGCWWWWRGVFHTACLKGQCDQNNWLEWASGGLSHSPQLQASVTPAVVRVDVTWPWWSGIPCNLQRFLLTPFAKGKRHTCPKGLVWLFSEIIIKNNNNSNRNPLFSFVSFAIGEKETTVCVIWGYKQ